MGTRFIKRVLRIDFKTTIYLKIDKFYFIKPKKIVLQKLKDEKKKLQDRRKYFQNIAFNKGPLWTMYKELIT